MNPMPADTDAIQRYLLSEASEAEAEVLEREYFAREEMLDGIAAVEQDLIEDYLSGRLAPGKRDRFESHYLASPLHRQRVAIARALRGRASPRRRSTWVAPLFALAATLTVTVLGTVWYLQSRPGGDQTRAITLPAVAVRGESAPPLARIGSDASAITLRLERGDNEAPPPFQVLLRTVEGGEIWRGPATAVAGGGGGSRQLIAEVTIPAAGLASGDYVVVLSSGAENVREVQRYYFRLLRR
jgi:hypothetical protein